MALSGKPLKENGFESMFSLTDTLEGHKDEKQRLPTAGNKLIFSNQIMTWYIRQSYIISILGLPTMWFFLCSVSLAIFNLFFSELLIHKKRLLFTLNTILNWLKTEAYWTIFKFQAHKDNYNTIIFFLGLRGKNEGPCCQLLHLSVIHFTTVKTSIK